MLRVFYDSPKTILGVDYLYRSFDSKEIEGEFIYLSKYDSIRCLTFNLLNNSLQPLNVKLETTIGM